MDARLYEEAPRENLPEAPHRRVGSHAVATGRNAYEQSPTGKGGISQGGNLQGKKQSAAETMAGSTSIGGPVSEEAKNVYSNSTTNSVIGQAKTLSPAKMVASQQLNSEFPEVIEEEQSVNGGPSLQYMLGADESFHKQSAASR